MPADGSGGTGGEGGSTSPSVRLDVVGPTGSLPGFSVNGSEMTTAAGTTVALSKPAFAPLIGSLAPTATISPSGDLVAYNSWDELASIDQSKSLDEQGVEPGTPAGIPTVRIADLHSGEETALEPGSMSPTFRADGALAYVVGAEPTYRVNMRYLGRVVVRETPSSEPVTWLDQPGRYVAYGWAGKRLVVYRISEGEHLEALVLDAPGKARLLADGAGVIALSPDGGQALVVDSQPPARVWTVDLASGKEVASIDLAEAEAPDGTPIMWAAYSGDWKGDRAVATAGPGLILLHADSASLRIEGVLTFDTTQYPGGFVEPRFVNGSTETVAGWSFQAGAADDPDGVLGVALVCDLSSGSCEQTNPDDPRRWNRLVYSTSTGGQ